MRSVALFGHENSKCCNACIIPNAFNVNPDKSRRRKRWIRAVAMANGANTVEALPFFWHATDLIFASSKALLTDIYCSQQLSTTNAFLFS